MAVQRLVLILPVEEQEDIPDVSENEKEEAKNATNLIKCDHIVSHIVSKERSNIVQDQLVHRAVFKEVSRGSWRSEVSRGEVTSRMLEGAKLFTLVSSSEDPWIRQADFEMSAKEYQQYVV